MLKRQWRFFFGLGAGLLALLAVGLAFDPNWIGKFLSIGGNKVSQTFGYHPTLWGLTSYLCQRQAGCSYLWGGILVVVFFLIFLWLVIKNKKRLTTSHVLGIVVVFALILTPYIWVYDQLLLLLPISVAVGLLIEKRNSFLLTTLTPIFISAFSLLLLPIAVKQRIDVWSALVPLATLVVMVLAIYTKENFNKSEN
jgi:hypothetical protein